MGVRKSMLFWQVLVSAAVSLALTVACLGLIWFQQNERRREFVERMVPGVANELKLVLGPALWNVDRNVAAEIVQSYLENRDISMIRVRSDIGGLDVTAWQDAAGAVLFSELRPARQDLGSIVAPAKAEVSYRGQRVGFIELEMNSRSLDGQLSREIGLFTMLLTFALGAVMALLALNSRLVVRNLGIVAETIGRTDAGVRGVRMPGFSIRELETVSVGFNHMAERLENYADEMEEKVRLRSDRLLESEKMAFLGSLMAGIAHELNTPLGICLTSISWFRERHQVVAEAFNAGVLPKDVLSDYLARGGEAMSLIQRNVERSAELVQAFKRISADHFTEAPTLFQVRQTLEEVRLSLGPSFAPASRELSITCPLELTVRCNRAALYQIVSNLVMNCHQHAYVPDTHGVIQVSARADDGQLRLEVSDHGRGIPLADQEKIFLPLFTTGRGRGLRGLGLSLVYNLVTKAGGTIECSSAPATGTTMVVRLPVLA